MKKLIVAFNGPPRSGKDYAAETLTYLMREVVDITSRHEKMSMPLKKAIGGMLDVYVNAIGYSNLEPTKDLISSTCFGNTYRNLQIELHHWAKELMGRSVFGELLLRRINRAALSLLGDERTFVIFVSDAGFDEEWPVVANEIPTLLIRIKREGCNFEGDSRSYIDIKNAIGVVDVVNKGDASFIDELVKIVEQYVKIVEDKDDAANDD